MALHAVAPRRTGRRWKSPACLSHRRNHMIGNDIFRKSNQKRDIMSGVAPFWVILFLRMRSKQNAVRGYLTMLSPISYTSRTLPDLNGLYSFIAYHHQIVSNMVEHTYDTIKNFILPVSVCICSCLSTSPASLARGHMGIELFRRIIRFLGGFPQESRFFAFSTQQ